MSVVPGLKSPLQGDLASPHVTSYEILQPVHDNSEPVTQMLGSTWLRQGSKRNILNSMDSGDGHESAGRYFERKRGTAVMASMDLLNKNIGGLSIGRRPITAGLNQMKPRGRGETVKTSG